MRPRPSRSFFAVLSALLAWIAVAGAGIAQDPAELARNAGKQLRTAERSMFAGKAEQASQELEGAAKLIASLAKLDPDNSRLRALRSKQQRLARDIARRLRRSEPPVEKEPPAGGEEKGDELPAGVAKRLAEVDQGIGKLRVHLTRDSLASPEDRAKNAERLLAAAAEPLAQIARIYGEQVPEDHPELVACRARLAAAREETEAFCAAVRADAEADEAQGPSAEQIAADAAKVSELYERFAEPLSRIHGNSLVYGLKPEDAERALAQIETVEGEALPVLQPFLARLAKTYGTSAMAINNKLHGLGTPREQQFGSEFERLLEGVQNVSKSRVASADTIARNAETMLSGIDSVAPDVRVPRMREWKGILRTGQRLDPNNAAINSWLADIDSRIADIAEAIEQDIDSKTWLGHVEDFSGPGDVDTLAASALDWFREDRGWGGNPDKKVEVLAVAVRGPWRVAERDVFGRVIRWRLPIHVAVTDEAMRRENVARVYDLSIVAMQGAPEAAPKTPPFDGCWVGANWKMRLDKLPR